MPASGLELGNFGGGRGIRTPEGLAALAVFKTAPINHSGIPPGASSVPWRIRCYPVAPMVATARRSFARRDVGRPRGRVISRAASTQLASQTDGSRLHLRGEARHCHG